MNFGENQQLFREEAQELLAKIEQALLSLELHPEDSDLVNEVFRSLHTIKGSGSMFGFTVVAEFTHSVENLFDEVRKGRLSINASIIDIGLRAGDCIAALLLDPGNTISAQEILADIAHVEQGLAKQFTPDKKPVLSRDRDMISLSGIEPETGGNPQAWRISFKPHLQILHRGINLEALLRELQEMGPCHAVAITEQLPEFAILEPTSLYLSWVITLSTIHSLSTIRAVFMFVEDYAELGILPIGGEDSQGGLVTPKIGEIMLSQGLIDEQDIQAFRKSQRPFGEVAVASGKVPARIIARNYVVSFPSSGSALFSILATFWLHPICYCAIMT